MSQGHHSDPRYKVKFQPKTKTIGNHKIHKLFVVYKLFNSRDCSAFHLSAQTIDDNDIPRGTRLWIPNEYIVMMVEDFVWIRDEYYSQINRIVEMGTTVKQFIEETK